MAFYLSKRKFGEVDELDSGMAKMSIGLMAIVAIGAAWLWLSGKKKG
jgi:hypothetical protein